MSHWYDSEAFVRRVQLNLDWFDRQHHHILFGGVHTNGTVDSHTKLAVKRAKWALGYPDVQILWGAGVDDRLVRSLHHPTLVGNPVWIARGLRRRRAWDRSRSAEHVSVHGVEFIADFEGYYANWYNDGTGTMTIGYGHTTESLRGFRPPLSRSQAMTLLRLDLEHDYEPYVRAGIHVPLTQNQFDALTSFAFNLGVSRGGLADLFADINARRYHDAADKMLNYDHAGGVVYAGLVRRRKAEHDLFLS